MSPLVPVFARQYRAIQGNTRQYAPRGKVCRGLGSFRPVGYRVLGIGRAVARCAAQEVVEGGVLVVFAAGACRTALTHSGAHPPRAQADSHGVAPPCRAHDTVMEEAADKPQTAPAGAPPIELARQHRRSP